MKPVNPTEKVFYKQQEKTFLINNLQRGQWFTLLTPFTVKLLQWKYLFSSPYYIKAFDLIDLDEMIKLLKKLKTNALTG